MKRSIFVLGFGFAMAGLCAQEVERPLGYNDILRKEWNARAQQRAAGNPHALAPGDTIGHPFFDDFSTTLIYPDTAKWTDDYVYVNRDMPIGPVTIGVATFDGVSPNGTPYDTLTSNPNQSVSCDTLTSKPINLSDISQSDTTVYLSFYYQGQGRGDKPDTDDSLLLEFHDPDSAATVWKQVWGHKGFGLTPTDTVFRVVMVRLDAEFIKNGFRFRFRNKATPSGYVDQWHLDYVYLNNGRNVNDTVFSDVAFVYNPHSLLAKYRAMPYEQYKASDMISVLTNYVRNNDTIVNNTFYTYKVRDAAFSLQYAADSGSFLIDPIYGSTYSQCSGGCPPLLNPPVNYSFPDPLPSPTYFNIQHFLKPPGSDIRTHNDTVNAQQKFFNYYAYDDGTAEMAYGLNTVGGQIAYRFTLNYPDSLRGLDMYFNWMPNGSVNSVTQRQFRITVWNDNGGVPGSVIYQDSIVTPAYQYEYHSDWGSLTNVFYRYPLTTPKHLSGTFYVGWVQYGQDLLNIGLDKNTNSNANMFYNVTGFWQNSVIAGSWMIRPLFGTASQMQHVTEQQGEPEGLTIFPNPASDVLYIQTSASNYDRMKVMILDAVGRPVMSEQRMSSDAIDISSLSNGIYFVRISGADGHLLTRKLIIAR